MDALNEAKSCEASLIQLRRDIHRHPELGWKEKRTQDVICKELDDIGLPYEKVCGTGVIAKLEGDLPGQVIGIRADMDALPISEKNNCEYVSENPGVMHACGHDCHVAMLLTAARILNRHKDIIHGSIKFIFQPAEEIIEGAHEMCRLKQLADIKRIFGAHVWNALDVGTFSAESGARFASADNFYITVRGTSAHGAQPHNSADAIVSACSIVGALQTITSRNVDPLEPAVVTVGTIEGGSSPNIIANQVKLSGTARSFSPRVRDFVEKRIGEISSDVAKAYWTECEYEYRRCTPATINDIASTEIVRDAVISLFGDAKLVHLEKTTGGEDFAWYLEDIPGAYLFIGSRNEKAGKYSPHHHECFDIDEQALVNGTAVLVQIGLTAGRDG